MKCPNCDFESPPEMRFCGMCGTSLTRTCPQCQFVNPVNYRFCGMCGTALEVNVNLPPAMPQRFTLSTQARQTSSSSLPPQTNPIEAGPTGAALDGERRVAT